MEAIGVDVFEQPLPADDLLGHARLRARAGIPIALDESVWSPRDVVNAVRTEAADTVVIKTSKMGGLYYARLCGQIAREAGLDFARRWLDRIDHRPHRQRLLIWTLT